MVLHQLLYVSAATKPFGNAALQTLVTSARSYNHDRGLTGLLLYSESLFLQMLEGEEAAVHEVYYDRIAADPRHTHLRLLADGPVAGCVFPTGASVSWTPCPQNWATSWATSASMAPTSWPSMPRLSPQC